MIFKDRYDAAAKLLPHLEKYKHHDGVILTVPRGGVPLGYYLSMKLHFPMELILTKKISHPDSPEFAIGAVSLEDVFIEHEGIPVPEDYLAKETKRIQKILKERYLKFMGNKRPINLLNKTVILVDDGVATGNTIMASLQMIRKRKPASVILAIPVAPPETLEKLKPYVDELICLYAPHNFNSVGQFYLNFEQVPDEEVIRLTKDLNIVHK